MIEVTADANIYISALEFAGVPLQVLDHARRGAVRLYVSEPILDDVRRVLRDKFLWQPDLIVTGDKDLLRLGSYNAIQILKAADFLKLLELPPESPAGEEHVP